MDAITNVEEESPSDELALLSLVGLVDEVFVDVRNDTTSRDRRLDEGVELFVSTDGQLQVPRGDALHLEILARVARQLQDLGRQVLKDGRRVHGGRGSDALRMVDRVLEETVDTTNGELKTRLGRPRLRGLLARGGLASLAALASFSALSRLVRKGRKVPSESTGRCSGASGPL